MRLEDFDLSEFVENWNKLPEVMKTTIRLTLSIEICNKVFEIVSKECPDIILRATKEVLEIG